MLCFSLVWGSCTVCLDLLALPLGVIFELYSVSVALCAFVRFALVWFCLFHLPLGVWEGLRFVIVALPGLFSYLFFNGHLLYYLALFFSEGDHASSTACYLPCIEIF